MAHEVSGSFVVTRETAKALYVEGDDGTRRWIPKAVIHDDSEVYAQGTSGKLVVEDWFAEKEGLE